MCPILLWGRCYDKPSKQVTHMTEHILIAYFSRSGNTRKIAQLIYQEIGGTLQEIEPEQPYPRAYNTVVDQAKREINAGYKPPLKSRLDQVDAFDLIFIGTPNWWRTIAPPVASFLSMYDFSGKTILPFCTHGGGGLGQVEVDIAQLCPHATVLRTIIIRDGGGLNAQIEVAAWLSKVMKRV